MKSAALLDKCFKAIYRWGGGQSRVDLSCCVFPSFVVFEGPNQSRFLGRGCDEALFSEKKGFSVKRGEAIH